MGDQLRGGTTIGGYLALHSGLDYAYIKGALALGGGLTLGGRLDLKGVGYNQGLSFYSPTYVTWIEYMTPSGAGYASTGGTAPTYGDVTSWAIRSTIESNAGYGWLWDSCANTASANPDPKMALSSSTGNLKIKGDFTCANLAVTGSTKTAGYFYGGTTAPSNSNRLNYDGDFYATKVWGAVYNDYAEFRQSREDISLGSVAVEGDDGYIIACRKRLSKNPMVITDTHGFGIGKQEIEGEYSLPIAVAGRVLAYTDKSRESFKVGDVVCSGNSGTVSKMRWWEKILFPDRILGVVSEIPSYEVWGTDNVKVGERVWIKVR